MRSFKFRAWDNIKKEWTLNIMECVSSSTGNIWMEPALKSHKVVIEQYTGLTDKNGKEIYEGDIVKQLMYVFEGKEHITTWVVRWNKKNCCFELHYLSGTLFGDSMMEDDEEYKVIGNIHENPELLEGEDEEN